MEKSQRIKTTLYLEPAVYKAVQERRTLLKLQQRTRDSTLSDVVNDAITRRLLKGNTRGNKRH